jgi:hypothetical protein
MLRNAEDEWQILAQFPSIEDRVIESFKSKAEVDEWLNEGRRIDWLRSQGYAFGSIALIFGGPQHVRFALNIDR